MNSYCKAHNFIISIKISGLIYSFNREVSREEFKRRIKDSTLPEICNYVSAHKSNVFFIAAGTLHAIGEGILMTDKSYF